MRKGTIIKEGDKFYLDAWQKTTSVGCKVGWAGSAVGCVYIRKIK